VGEITAGVVSQAPDVSSRRLHPWEQLMNDRQIDVRALEALLHEPEIVAWLGLSKKEFDSFVHSTRQNEHKPPEPSK
jgi:hypothetical protein